jgi:NADH-quinone oxidoreductase subunit L
MALPLVVLAVFAAVAGFVGVPPGAGLFQRFLAPVFHGAGPEHAAEGGVLGPALVSLAVAIAGIAVATRLYVQRPDLPARLAARYPRLYRTLWNKYYVDELYDRLIVEPTRRAAAALWRGVDEPVIDGSVNGLGSFVAAASLLVRRVQSGYVMTYVLSFLAGVVLVVGYLTFGG